MTLEQEVIALRAENAALRAELVAALKRIAESGRGEKQSPSFAEASKPKKAGPKGPRRKRRPEHSRACRRETPTKSVACKLEECRGLRLPAAWAQRCWRRQVIELPPPQPVEVTEHVVHKP